MPVVVFIRAGVDEAIVEVDGVRTCVACTRKDDPLGLDEPRRDPDEVDPVLIQDHDDRVAEYWRKAVLETPQEAAARWAKDAYGVELTFVLPDVLQQLANAPEVLKALQQLLQK